MTRREPLPPVVVMGVSGVGKSSIAAAIASETGGLFLDADDLHPPANIAKMASGRPLDDDDRAPWLDLVGAAIARGDAVVACSALKRAYRDRIRDAAPNAYVVALDAGAAVIAARMRDRPGHFMPTTLLDSQLSALEPLQIDEPGVTIDANQSIAEVARVAVAALRSSLAIEPDSGRSDTSSSRQA